MRHIEEIEYIEGCAGNKARECREKVLELLSLYAEFSDNERMKKSLIVELDRWAYRLKLGYFGRFI